mmetsp:Transcript_12135/g.25468  ORF Transcript_12135/g.25468 Transcript_12135/m.25468 type:complete len:85 (+) Transcript_12135:375-629(+)
MEAGLFVSRMEGEEDVNEKVAPKPQEVGPRSALPTEAGSGASVRAALNPRSAVQLHFALRMEVDTAASMSVARKQRLAAKLLFV